MKKYFLVGLLLVSNYAFAIFEDEEARKKINEMQDQLNNIEKSLEFKINQKFSKNLSNYSSELNELHDTIAKLIGDIEVLQFELKNSEERNKVIYKELNERIVKLESRIEEQSQNKPNDSLVDTEKNLTKDNIDKQSEESQIQDNGLAPLVDINIELDAY